MVIEYAKVPTLDVAVRRAYTPHEKSVQEGFLLQLPGQDFEFLTNLNDVIKKVFYYGFERPEPYSIGLKINVTDKIGQVSRDGKPYFPHCTPNKELTKAQKLLINYSFQEMIKQWKQIHDKNVLPYIWH